MNLLLLERDELRPNQRAELSVERAAHVRDVLQAKVGSRLHVGVRDGALGHADISAWNEGRLSLCNIELSQTPPPRSGVCLLLALPRPKVLRRVLATTASLGVKRVVLVNAARVDKAYWDSPVLESRAIQKAFDVGLEQAQDTVSPEIELQPRFRPFVEDSLPARVDVGRPGWLLHPRASATFAPETKEGAPPTGTERWVAIGPETGWIDFELELLGASGLEPLSLGERILRVETVVPFVLGLASRA